MNKDPKYFLSHIVESIELISKYTKGLTLKDFENSQEIQDAVLRRFEIIGEATKNIPDNIRAENRDIPWNFMAGMRDVIIHDYFGVKVETIWKTAKEDLPLLGKKIKKLLDKL